MMGIILLFLLFMNTGTTMNAMKMISTPTLTLMFFMAMPVRTQARKLFSRMHMATNGLVMMVTVMNKKKMISTLPTS